MRSSTAAPLLCMPDVQARHDPRALPIARVGVKNLRYPIAWEQAGRVQHSVGLWSLYVGLRAEQKGAHMSRLLAWLDAFTQADDGCSEAVNFARLQAALPTLLALLQTSSAGLEVQFPFFIRKSAPVSGLQSLLAYDGGWSVTHSAGAATEIRMQATVPVKSLCPCSKEVSDEGAHNQRSHIRLEVLLNAPLDWTELVRFAEDNASCELWGLLKRNDEKWVTERAYAQPKFVEDLVRDVALALEREPRVDAYTVDVTNFESIHAHDVQAQLTRDKRVSA
ncbi:GTP cyclohydrolase FolE2 [Hydrogenophaga sp.]|uniref:GTP cyclohydrolase FolE2 n=1 Tax=Hydrogenophaga sp. TaxID=1904254 RepID=UPI0019AB6CC0|nr:GTP cyclohydrolase FolE2 [Hydrogenophaga sp.]MBD3894034.1 GTP cyclohydrolase I FolE2 [Hydrogenophaga sp.]